jgi:hypothetical protein
MHMMEACPYCFPWIFPILFPIIFPMLFWFFFGNRFGWPGPFNNGPQRGVDRRYEDSPEPSNRSTSNAMQILDERLVKGEITKEEYQDLKNALKG